MKFTYTYRSSDGQRHTAEIEAESRDAAFARVRSELGVKPIKVVLAEPGPASSTGGGNGRSSARRTVAYVLSVVLVLLALGGVWWTRRAGDDAPYQVMTPQGPVTYTVAQPLPRQALPGDRTRIEAARSSVFRSPAEVYLARYAEPGRQPKVSQMPRPQSLADAFKTCLREPLRIASTDFTEIVDLKRIVAGMKREMGAYLAGGGTVDGYLAELEKRQRLEASYRDSAEKRLGEMLEKAGNAAARGAAGPSDPLAAAYAYWLKANASLKSMGIYELPLPDALRGYQATLDLGE